MAVVTDRERDTVAIHHALRVERLTSRMHTVSPRLAGRLLGQPLPAIYLVRGSRVIRHWYPSRTGGAVPIERDAIVRALGDTTAPPRGR